MRSWRDESHAKNSTNKIDRLLCRIPTVSSTVHRDAPISLHLQGRVLTSASIVRTWLDGKQKPSALLQQPANTTSDSCGGDGSINSEPLSTGGIWALDKNARKARWAGWEAAIKAEVAEKVTKKVKAHDTLARELSGLQRQKDVQRVRAARVVGCTTTGAAIHHSLLAEARCGVVLVEEAAEVLEAHVLAALGDSTKHLIMIGEGAFCGSRFRCCRRWW